MCRRHTPIRLALASLGSSGSLFALGSLLLGSPCGFRLDTGQPRPDSGARLLDQDGHLGERIAVADDCPTSGHHPSVVFRAEDIVIVRLDRSCVGEFHLETL